MIQRLPTFFLALLAFFSLAACQSTPNGGLSAEQIAVLKAQGFKLTEDGWTLDLASKILFKTNSDAISDSSRTHLADITHALLGVGLAEVTLEGHTDDQGSAAYNKELSVRRAKRVAEVMLGNGMQDNNITVRGMGQSRPIADNSSAQGRSENRRVAIIVGAQ